MSTPQLPDEKELFSARLISSERITAPEAREEVRHLVFKTETPGFDVRTGQSIRVFAPGQYGNRYHPRLYSIADPERETEDGSEFTLCVRRHRYVDDFNGEQYPGIASNFLCDLKPGDAISFTGPFGLAFPVPSDRKAALLMIGTGTGIAPFRAFVRHLHENLGGWEGKIRLFYGAPTGLEMLYMNEENHDLANYFDEKTFQAFQALSPRPAFDLPADVGSALKQNAGEVWEMLQNTMTQVFIAGPQHLLVQTETALVDIAGSVDAWAKKKAELQAAERWHEVLY